MQFYRVPTNVQKYRNQRERDLVDGNGKVGGGGGGGLPAVVRYTGGLSWPRNKSLVCLFCTKLSTHTCLTLCKTSLPLISDIDNGKLNLQLYQYHFHFKSQREERERILYYRERDRDRGNHPLRLQTSFVPLKGLDPPTHSSPHHQVQHQTETNRQTDRQTDKQGVRERDSEREREGGDRQTDRQTER